MKRLAWAYCAALAAGLACRGGAEAPAPQRADARPTPVAVAAAGTAAPAAPPTPRLWHGIGLRQVPDCEQCCGLVFPEGYGSKGGNELGVLEEIVKGEGRAKELGCHFHYKKQALAQLRDIAVKSQSREGASVILHAGSDDGVDLGGGELTETFGAEYLAPVLQRYEGLAALLTPKLERNVADRLCASAYSMVPDQSVDVNGIVASLKRRGVAGLAKTIQTTCAEIRRERQ